MPSKKRNRLTPPHKLDIQTPDELYAALTVFPLTSCIWEAKCILSTQHIENPPSDLIAWQAYWWDLCNYNLGYGITRIMVDISSPDVWSSIQAEQAGTDSLTLVRAASMDAFEAHYNNFRERVFCFMSRMWQKSSEIEARTGYARGITEQAVKDTGHIADIMRHREQCLS